jgi:hypothetical protein
MYFFSKMRCDALSLKLSTLQGGTQGDLPTMGRWSEEALQIYESHSNPASPQGTCLALENRTQNREERIKESECGV